MILSYPTTLTAVPQFRGERNNNPLNLRLLKPAVPWLGAVPANLQTDPDFVQFQTPQHGIRAAALDMQTQALRANSSHTITLAQLVRIWAPAIENNTDAYIATVCNHCFADPADLWPTNSLNAMQVLIPAFIIQENGRSIYPSDLITEALQMLPGWLA